MGIGNDEVNVRITGESAGITDAMKEASDSTKRAAAEIRSQLGDLYSSFDKLDAGIKKLSETTVSNTAKIGLSVAAYDTLFRAIEMVGRGMVTAVSNSLKLGAELNRTSIIAGTTREEMSSLSFVAQQFDVQIGSLGNALKTMQQRLSQAEDGGRAAAGAFSDIGLEVDALKAMRPDQQFQAIAERIADIEDPAERTRLAVQLFGNAGRELLPMFEEGAAGIQAARDRAEELGLTLDGETIKALADAKSKMDDLKQAGESLAAKLVGRVAPAFAEVAKLATEFISGDSAALLQRRVQFLQGEIQRNGRFMSDASIRELQNSIADAQKQINELRSASDVARFDAESKAIRRRADQRAAPMLDEVTVSAPRSLTKPPKTDEDKLLEGFERLPARMNEIDREITANYKASAKERTAEFDREAREIVGKTGKALYDLKETNDNIANDYERTWLARLQPISAAFNKSITGMIMGTQTLRQSVANIGRSIVAEFINMSVQSATAWIAQQIRMAVFQRATAKGNVLSNAAEAGSGAYKAIVGIPYVGPFLAPIAAAAAFAGTVAFGARIPSARQGWSVPTGVNPITQLHEDEMVLPANLSKAVRDMAAGNGGAGGGQPLNVSLSIPAIDGASVRRLVGSSEFQRQLRGAFQRAGVSVA